MRTLVSWYLKLNLLVLQMYTYACTKCGGHAKCLVFLAKGQAQLSICGWQFVRRLHPVVAQIRDAFTLDAMYALLESHDARQIYT